MSRIISVVVFNAQWIARGPNTKYQGIFNCLKANDQVEYANANAVSKYTYPKLGKLSDVKFLTL